MKLYRSTLLLLLVLMVASIPLSAQERPMPLPDNNAGRGLDTIINGGFETDTDWTERSLLYPGDIICNTGCGNGGGTAGPHTGTGFVWFGGATLEGSSLSQSLTLTPVNGTTNIVSFWLWNGTLTRSTDRFFVQFNNLPVFEVQEGTQPYASGYSEVLLNFSGLSSGALTFASTSFDELITNFSLDDVSVMTDVEDLILNGDFDDLIDPLANWTTPGSSGDAEQCTTTSPFTGCEYQFKGSRYESSKLRQNAQLPSGGFIPSGSRLVTSFWAQVKPGVILSATLKVKLADGTSQKVKILANHNPLTDESGAINGNQYPWKIYQLPTLTLPQAVVTQPVFTILHKSLKKVVTVSVDNVSLAYLPPAP